MSWKFVGIGILLIVIAYVLMAISPLYLIFSFLLRATNLWPSFFPLTGRWLF